MSKRSFGIIASVLAATLAVGAAAIVRARTNGTGSSDSGPTASSLSQTSSADQTNGLSRLLSVTPDGNGARYGAYAAPATVSGTSSSWINKYYPKQAAATQASDPATHFWALIIGINDYSGSTASNVGSRQDAESLSSYLQKLGWRSDHILLLRDLPATASHIVDAIRWLASKTDSSSTAVFHYAGHENWRPSSSEDTGREVAIWASDNKMIYEKALGKELGRVRAAHMWLDFATCRAAGFDEAGMVTSGRVLTYSSTKGEYSYEDPKLHHSVFGWFLINQSLIGKKGNTNHDNTITVEEAFAYAKPNVSSYTNGAQHPVMIDKTNGKFGLRVPPASKPAPSSSSGPSPTPSTVPKTCVVLCF